MSQAGGGGFSWKSLQFWASIPVLLVSLFIGGLFFRPFLVISVVLIAGLVLSRRPGKAGPILLLVGAILTILLNVGDPGLIPAFVNLNAAADYVPRLLGVGGAIVALIAGIMALRQGATPSPAAKTFGMAALAVGVLLIAASAFLTATFESDARESGDAQVSAKDFEFEQEQVVADGPEVVVFFTNPDPSLHTFTIDALEVDLAVPPGKAKRVAFQAEPGTYDFYCVPHPDMKGKLVVS
jgi:plastocyanin